MDKKFTLRYLPLFEQDMVAVRDYILNTLQNPIAAQKLVDDTEKAILKRLDNPLGFTPYRSAKKRKLPYYWIGIRNYMVFYVVDGDIMEARRFLYAKRNLQDIL